MLLADDLTGACDAAAPFLKAGFSVRVWFGANAQFAASETVQAFNTDSRALPPNLAALAVTRAVAALDAADNTLFFKKIDSAARGPLASEILAAHRALGTRAVLLAPAFPENGRTVRQGILDIRDASGQSTQIDLTTIFPPRIRASVGVISTPAQLEPALQSGKTILVCDSSAQSDLDALVRSAEFLPHLLYAGSAGLARALASLHAENAPSVVPPCVAPVLVIAGSPHPLTALQLAHLEPGLASGTHLLRLQDPCPAGEHILAAFKQFAPRALVLTGGDTALLAVRTLGAHSFILQGEIAPGIPWGIVKGGEAENCVVVTKSGGFGSPTVFNEILAALRGPA